MLASAKDLRLHTRELLNIVESGEEVIITFHGKACAKLIPIRDEQSKLPADKDILFGIWQDHSIKDPADYVRNIRKGRFE